jgi:TonB family protein
MIAGGIVDVVAQTQVRTVRLSEMATRGQATSRPKPAYPTSSIAARSAGVVVVAIEGSTEGRIDRVEVLQSPDEAMATAVKGASSNWIVSPFTRGYPPEPVRFATKLTFYFRIVDGQGRVTFPDEMPGGPELPAFRPPAAANAPPPPPPPSAPMASSGESHGLSPHDELSDEQFNELLRTTKVTVLDARERSEFSRERRPDAINIPLDELPVRAAIELDTKKPVVVDCSRESRGRCTIAAAMLAVAKFVRVLIYLP